MPKIAHQWHKYTVYDWLYGGAVPEVREIIEFYYNDNIYDKKWVILNNPTKSSPKYLLLRALK